MRFKLRYVGFAAVLSLIGFVSQAAAATDLSVTEASGNPGQEVSVNLLLNTDAGISGLGLSVLYDETKLSVVTAVATDFGNSFSAIVNPALENEIRVTAARFPAPDPGSGSIVDITFLIAENAPEGDITLELQVGELLDANEEAIEFTAANGKITVINRPPTVTALDPASGVEAGGQLVTIIGVDTGDDYRCEFRFRGGGHRHLRRDRVGRDLCGCHEPDHGLPPRHGCGGPGGDQPGWAALRASNLHLRLSAYSDPYRPGLRG
jgi:hypothetical protein